jgi:hypothetical protein
MQMEIIKKIYHCFWLSFFITILIIPSIESQTLPKILDAPIQFSKGEQKKVEKANELINAGIAIWDRLVKEYNPKDITNYKTDSLYYAKAYPLLIDASQNFEEGNNMKFEVYRKNCAAFWSQHKYDSPSGLESAKKFQKEASNYFQKSQLNRQAAASYNKEYAKAFDRFFEAISLEIIAVKKEGRALQLYKDWPVHYDYVWDVDIEKNLFPSKSEVKPVEPIVAVKEDIKPKVDTGVKTKTPEIEPYDSTVIYYQVQIVAHTSSLNSSYIKLNVYNGDMPIETLKEEGWFKYVIGRYRTLEEANQLLQQIKVPKAFVVAYKNHKRVPIKEATGK